MGNETFQLSKSISDIRLIRYLGAALIVLLALVAVYPSLPSGHYLLLKISVSLLCLLLVLYTYENKKYTWTFVFTLILLWFNPLLPLRLPQGVWRISDFIALTAFAVFLRTYYEDYEKGVHFQNYITKLFPSAYWTLRDRTKDFTNELGRLVLSDMNPDLTLLESATKQSIAVECKFRSRNFDRYGQKGFKWNERQGYRYKRYGEQHNMAVYIALGIGGRPQKPKQLFFLPLEVLNDCRYGFVSMDKIQKFEYNQELGAVKSLTDFLH